MMVEQALMRRTCNKQAEVGMQGSDGKTYANKVDMQQVGGSTHIRWA